MTNFPVDVLICCYNDGALVPGALDSLQRQSVGTDSFRVIFVDNGSTDNTRAMMEQSAGTLRIEYVYEPTVGYSHAVNVRYTHCKAPYVAHLDADARADPRWMENILRVITEKAADLCGGPYFPFYILPKPAWFLDRYVGHYCGPQARYLKEDEYLSGPNMVWRRQVVEDLGGLRVGLGLVGRGVARGDETNLIIRARHEVPGFSVYYDPEIVVHALARDELFSIQYWLRRSFANGRRHQQVWETGGNGSSRFVAVLSLAVTTAKLVIEGARGFLWRDKAIHPYWRNYWLERVSPLVQGLGVAWERVARG